MTLVQVQHPSDMKPFATDFLGGFNMVENEVAYD